MANQKQNFTAEMRKATGPNSPPGGSKLVRGREPTVVGQANMRQHMLMQTTAGYPIEEHRKVWIFRKSVLGHHLIAGILADFDHENLDPLLQTYDNITAYVKKHLPNVRSAADMASSAGRALSAVDAGAASLAQGYVPR